MSVNPFVNNTKALPKQDSMIVRVSMDQIDLGGRKDHLPSEDKDSRMTIKHVPNNG